MEINVDYVTIWDGGSTEIRTPAKFNTETKVVFDVEVVDGIDEDGEEVEILEEEYIELPDGSVLTRDSGEFIHEDDL